MKNSSIIILMLTILTCFWLPPFAAADDGKQQLETPTLSSVLNWENPHRRTGIHDGNRIRSAFSNFGDLGSRIVEMLRGAIPYTCVSANPSAICLSIGTASPVAIAPSAK